MKMLRRNIRDIAKLYEESQQNAQKLCKRKNKFLEEIEVVLGKAETTNFISKLNRSRQDTNQQYCYARIRHEHVKQ